MHLYLIQHAEAKSAEADPSRGLTARGLQDAQKVAWYLGKIGITVSHLYHSGKTRARETAFALAEGIRVGRGVYDSDGLLPNDDPSIWHDRAQSLEEDTALVGHLPHLAKLASLILAGDREGVHVSFRMGGVVCLARQGSVWSLEWMIIPGILPPG
ncbi:MAG: Histidine phosphatase superfamily (branch 1) [Syntrophorhabdus sp. PtaU1.Bin153]|nr:MAG: Histidine phosphatase superfamily (branch 1) [Syntrophorhabdus sp. PtaU1.Bin153]